MVSMSFGGSEFSADYGCNFLFSTPSGHPAITFLASTGDNGAPGGYPAYSPEVVAVGDIVPADNLAYLLKYDSIQGRFEGTVSSTKSSPDKEAARAYVKSLRTQKRYLADVY